MIKAEHAGDTCSAFSDVVNFVVGRTQDLQGVPWWSTYQVLGKMILNIFTPQLDDVEICCFEAITIPIVCS
ncbi:Uncharacterised protein [Escherichia coli]|uniref:Uncharacterized protein n=1 Tax=Escherichia coli TaxID=562 RepID=A0A2X1N2I0_ECOLX|nr:Uncharacterised protein [Escherichia coli]